MRTAESKIKNIFTYLTPSFISNLLPFFTFPIITRFLTTKDFGIIALATVIPSLIVSTISCNVQIGAERYYFEYRTNERNLRKLINTTIYYLIFVFGISAILVFLLKDFLSFIIMGEYKYGFAISIIYLDLCLGTIVGFYLLLYRNMENAKKFAFFTTIQMLANSILTLVLIVGFRFGYLGMIYASFFASCGTFFVLFLRFSRNYPFVFSKEILIDNIKYGLPLMPGNFTGVITQAFDKYLLRSFYSLSITGIYSVAQNITKKISVIMTAIQATFNPIFMKDIFDKGIDGARSVGRHFTVFSFLSLFLILMTILFGEEIVYFLAPPSYYGVINIFMIHLCALSMQTFGKITGAQLAYVKKAYLSVPVGFLSLVVNMLLNVLLIPRWGAMGAMFATLGMLFVGNSIGVIIAQKHYKIIYEYKTLFFLYLNVFLSALFLILFGKAGIHFIFKYALKFIFLLTYICLGFQANIVSRKNVVILFNIFSLKKASVTLRAPSIAPEMD